MAINLINSENSFVRFGDPVPTACIWGDIDYCLPVYEATDVNFQFIINADTEGESNELCKTGATEVLVELVRNCDDADSVLAFALKPQRFRLSPTQVLYNWEHGFPGFPGPAYDLLLVGQCFKIRVTIFTGVYLIPETFCSNCFERISDPCFTSVLEYGNDEDVFGFKYCYGGGVDEAPVTCEPTIISFTNVATLQIPYTASLQAKYGNIPNIQTWIYDPFGVLTNMGIQTTFDMYPPTLINWDFGGLATGIIVLR